MQIYLKGYYGYQNFWDEMLLFGVIEKIFSDYQVEQLVIEIGDLEWIKQRKERNLNFITEYYRFRGVEVNREKIQFFQPHQRSQTILPQRIKALLPAKWLTYLALILVFQSLLRWRSDRGNQTLPSQRTKYPIPLPEIRPADTLWTMGRFWTPDEMDNETPFFLSLPLCKKYSSKRWSFLSLGKKSKPKLPQKSRL